MLTLSKITKKKISIENTEEIDVVLTFLQQYQKSKSQLLLNSILMQRKAHSSFENIFQKTKSTKSRKKIESTFSLKNKQSVNKLNDHITYFQKQEIEINEHRLSKYQQQKPLKHPVLQETPNFEFTIKQKTTNGVPVIQNCTKLNILPYLDNASINLKAPELYNDNNSIESSKQYQINNFYEDKPIIENNKNYNHNFNSNKPIKTLENKKYGRDLNQEDIFATKIQNTNYSSNIQYSILPKQILIPKQPFESKLVISRIFQPSKISDYIQQRLTNNITLIKNKILDQNLYKFQQKNSVNQQNLLKQYTKSKQIIKYDQRQSSSNPLDWATPPRPLTPPFKQNPQIVNMQIQAKQKQKCKLPRKKIEKITRNNLQNNNSEKEIINKNFGGRSKTDRSYTKMNPLRQNVYRKQNYIDYVNQFQNNQKQIISKISIYNKIQDQQDNKTVRELYLDLSKLQKQNQNDHQSDSDYEPKRNQVLFMQLIKDQDHQQYQN